MKTPRKAQTKTKTKAKTKTKTKAKAKPARSTTSADTTAAVDELVAQLVHPQKPAIVALREVISGADPSIAEGVKWNAPSFRTSEYFATFHLRAKTGVAVVLHLGAKGRKTSKLDIEDPAGLLTWLGKDRAMATFAGLADVKAREAAFRSLVRQWLRHV